MIALAPRFRAAAALLRRVPEALRCSATPRTDEADFPRPSPFVLTLEETVLRALGFPSDIPDAELAQAVAAQAGLQRPLCQETVDLLVRLVRGIEANLLDIPHPVSHGGAAELVVGPAFAALADGGFYRVRDDLGHDQVGEVLWWWFGRDVAPALERAGLIRLVGIPFTGPVPLEGT